MDTVKTRKAIVLDTNFIVERKDAFKKTIEALSENYDVFVTEISINERVSQYYMEIKDAYSKIEKCKKELSHYATITENKDFKEYFREKEKGVRATYKKYLKDKIIKFNSNNETLNEVLERLYRKTPPFFSESNSSDKGFKDTLLWMSIIHYFKDINEDINIVFVSNDRGFGKYADELIAEFYEKTGKVIEIKENSYYKVLLGETPELDQKDRIEVKELTDTEKREFRERITSVIDNICHITTYDDYSHNEYWEKTFSINKKLQSEEMQSIFDNLKITLENHIFDTHIQAEVVFKPVAETINNYEIPIEYLEEAYELYQTIKAKYNEYLTPFLNAACEIINRNYEEIRDIKNDDDDGLPF